jgi:hypothetical protein
MSHPHPAPHYIYYRRFGMFRRVWWFALGAGAATLWMRHHEERQQRIGDGTNTQSRHCGWAWRRPVDQAPAQAQAPYAYDWASHRPGLRSEAAVPTTPAPAPAGVHGIPAAMPAAAPVAAPAQPQPQPRAQDAAPPYYPSEEDVARLRATKRELEARTKEYAVEKLERLSAAIDRLRDGLQAEQRRSAPAAPPSEDTEMRFV